MGQKRSIEDRVRHWWPGYWQGFVEGLLVGVASGFLLAMVFSHG